jgi:mono/diheme cytochrome c family protein
MGVRLLAVVILFAACDRVPNEQRSEWSPRDHTGETKGGAKQGERRSDPSGASALGDLAWSNQCANCHGAGGRGDGPMGPSSGARDLTQAELAPGQIASAIQNGKGRMPKFELPDEVVVALVQKVQSFRK